MGATILFALAYPFLLPGFILRMCRRGGYAARMNDRFALYPKGFFGDDFLKSGPVWIHAVSVGEVQVAAQLMRQWRKVEPGVRFCFSTTSSTGWKMAEKELRDQDRLIYNPLDFPNFVKSALKTVRPRAVVLTESEIWPNFIITARKMSIPLFLINARVSDRSAPRYKAGRFFFKDVFKCFAKIYAQSELDASRLRAAMESSDAGKVVVTGSFKFDVASRNAAKEQEMRQWVGEGRLLLGGSTWPGEDEVLLKIYSRLRGKVKLVLAPRHFEKADAVEANITAAGFECVRRSENLAGYDFIGPIDTHWHTFGYDVGMMNEFYELKPGESVRNVLMYNSDTLNVNGVKNTAKKLSNINEWTKISDRVYIWDYCVNFANYLLPFPKKALINLFLIL